MRYSQIALRYEKAEIIPHRGYVSSYIHLDTRGCTELEDGCYEQSDTYECISAEKILRIPETHPWFNIVQYVYDIQHLPRDRDSSTFDATESDRRVYYLISKFSYLIEPTLRIYLISPSSNVKTTASKTENRS